MTACLAYVGVGAAIAIVTLCARGLRQIIDQVAERAGMEVDHARRVWIAATLIMWPIGLVVLFTGKTLLTGQTSDISVRQSSLETDRSGVDDLDIRADRLESPPHRQP